MKKESIKEVNLARVLSKYTDEEIAALLDTILLHHKQRHNTPKIPLSIFSKRELGVLEIIVKCLKENFSLSISSIALLLNRDEHTIWSTFYSSQKKVNTKFDLLSEEHHIPISIFTDRKMAPLETLIVHLRDEKKLRFTEISEILNRSYRNVWLSYQNGKRGLNEQNK